jgi:4-hydroxybenzoate polyprenyltransferase
MPVDDKAPAASPSRLTTWGRLLRLPNLFTVPGDPVAGYLLASRGVLGWAGRLGWDVLGAVAAALCLYCAGLLLNDYFDRHVDARERPDRPIPSGAVKPRTVLIVGLLLLAAGPVIACAVCGGWAGAIAAVTALLVYAYDAGIKNVPWLGPVVMGSCRAVSVLIGAGAAAGGAPLAPLPFIAAGLTWVYTTSVTVIAAGEATGERPGRRAYIPGAVILIACLSLALVARARSGWWPWWVLTSWRGLYDGGLIWSINRAVVLWGALFLLAAVEAELLALRARRGHMRTPPLVGRLIRVMIAIQAAWCVWGGLRSHTSVWNLISVIAAYLGVRCAAGLAARRFYGS